jgi:5-formyltetrahydrofolate cyclo-ligase
MEKSLEKRALRPAMVARILAVPAEQRHAEAATLAAIFESLPGFAGAATVLLYRSAFVEEFATEPMFLRAWAQGKRLVCPRVDRATRRLRLYEVSDLVADFAPGTLQIPEPKPTCPPVEPSAIDWALVPGLAFDRRGYRLGRGAGHYDRLLPTLRPDAPRWALAYDCQLVEALPVELHDQPLDGVATAYRRWPAVR